MLRKFMIPICAIVLLGLPVCAVAEEAAMSLEEIIAKNIEARGGREAIDNVKSMRISATAGSPMGGGIEFPLTIEMKRPDKIRVEFTVQGMTGIQAYDGETGWFVMPFAGKTEPEAMSEQQIKDVREQADIDGPLIDWKDKGHTLELVGKEDVEGTEAYNLKLTKKNGDVDTYYLDAEYFLEIKMEGKREFQGTEMEIEVNYGDYKEVGGLMIPHSTDQRPKGAPAGQTFTISKVDINPDLSDDRFAMPEVKSEGEGTE